MKWEPLGDEFPGHERVRGRECEIVLQPRPAYCDRGNFIALIFPYAGTELARDLDVADGWPRYFFDRERAKLELEAWLVKRRQGDDVAA